MYNTVLLYTCVVFQNGHTPLHIAADNGHLELVKEMLQHRDISAALTMPDDVSNANTR